MTFQIPKLDREGIERLVSWGRGGLVPLWFLPIGDWPACEEKRWLAAFGAGGAAEELGLYIGRSGEHGGAFRADALKPLFFNLDVKAAATRYLLVMSAGFPSPGFAVLLEADALDVERFSSVISQMVPVEIRELAAPVNREWGALRDLNFGGMRREFRSRIKLQKQYEQRLVEVAALDFRADVSDLEGLAKKVHDSGEWQASAGAGVDPAKEALHAAWEKLCQQRFLRDLQAMSPDVASLEKEFLSGRTPAQWHHIEADRVRKAIKGRVDSGSLKLADQAALDQFFEVEFHEARAAVLTALSNLLGHVNRELKPLTAKEAEFKARERRLYSESLPVIEASRQLGPALLLDLLNQYVPTSAKCLYWDPARMIGARLQTGAFDIPASILKSSADSLIRELGAKPALNVEQPVGSVDDGLFSDYVHYVYATLAATRPQPQRPQVGIRQIAVSLLEHSVPADAAPRIGWSQQLYEWGWSEDDDGISREGEWSQEPNKSIALATQADSRLSEVRIAAEGFVKDLLTVVLNRLAELSGDLAPGITDSFDALLGRGRSAAPLDNLTLGDDRIEPVLRTFLERVGGNVAGLSEFMEALGYVKRSGNFDAHHQSRQSQDGVDRDKIRACIATLLATANEWVGSMPWHFVPSYVCGRGPVVAIGRAWRHTDSMSREIRVLGHSAAEFDGLDEGEDLLVWNPSERNPVMTSAVFMRPERPRFSTRKAEEEPHRGSS